MHIYKSLTLHNWLAKKHCCIGCAPIAKVLPSGVNGQTRCSAIMLLLQFRINFRPGLLHFNAVETAG